MEQYPDTTPTPSVGVSLSALAGQPIATVPPSHALQPQGVALALLLATAPTAGFYPVEFIEDGQVTIPNLITLVGKGNSGTAELVVNDGLLRTHLDSMVFAIDNTDGGAFYLNLHIAKRPITDFAAASADAKSYFSQTFTIAIGPAQLRHIELRRMMGQYVVADRTLDLPTV